MSFKSHMEDFGSVILEILLFFVRFVVDVVQLAISYVIINNIIKIFKKKPDSVLGGGHSTLNEPDIGLMIFCIVLLAVVCFIKLKFIYKDFMEFHTLLILAEMLLSPIRLLLGIIKYILVIFFHFESEYDVDTTDGAFQKILIFVFAVNIPDDSFDTTPLGNLLTQLFVLLPLAALSTFCFYSLFIPSVLTKIFGFEVYILVRFFAFYGLTLITMFYVDLRKMESTVQYWDSNFVFKNRYTNDKVRIKSDSHYYSVNDAAYDCGWEKTSGGYTWIPTTAFYLFYFLSPILVFLQAISIFFAIIAMFTPHIYSCFGNSDIEDEIHLRGLQKILYFLFCFVIR